MSAANLRDIAAGKGPLNDKKLEQAQRWVDEDWESHDVDRDAVKLITRLLETVRSLRAAR
jgi:hypothetical protein